MNMNIKRRALANATEQLINAGASVISFRADLATPVMNIECPPVWLVAKSQAVTERIGGKRITSGVARVSGCVVRWIERAEDEPSLAADFNQYSPGLIALWPKNF
ncbi:hypothetical protein [Vibrio parahaemolyticus]|uniref:hypothetical protein n=1 Tax=Vibrio parahaemolyticus TaxID=670 RepID=UPI0004E695FE|nr:hypothetical protein [Vibrio parahaemolyticus]KFE96062.1 hypothetical protein HB39_04720 [Vibrio parahaemolyticus]MBX5339532.1 hypothetical protein [Vibrio parahaemolyticus]